MFLKFSCFVWLNISNLHFWTLNPSADNLLVKWFHFFLDNVFVNIFFQVSFQMNFLYTFPLTDYFAVISLLYGTHDELSSIYVIAYCHFMFQMLNFIIFTLANNCLRWTYFRPTRFIHPWTTLVHATLHVRVSSVIYKCNSWLSDAKFDWRYVIVKVVERNNQSRHIIMFLCHCVCKI